MLKVTTLFIAAAAALGMSSLVSAQSTPPPSYTTAQAAALWGYMSDSWTRSTNGNTNKFSYTPTPSSVPPSATPGNYTTIKRMGDGFTLEQKGYSPVPGRDLAHPVALQRPIPKAAMAKALAKTLPLVGTLLAAKELIDLLYPSSTNTYNQDTGNWQSGDSYTASNLPPSMFNDVGYDIVSGLPGCGAPHLDRWSWTASSGIVCANASSTTYQVWAWVSTPTKNSLVSKGWTWAQDDYDKHRVQSPEWPRSRTTQQPDPVILDTPTLAEKLGTLFIFPPIADELLPYIPEPARKDLAEESKGPGISVIPYTPDGVVMDEPWTHQDAINRWRTGAQGSPIEKTTTTTTIKAMPVPDGLRYDTTKTETKQTQKLDPVTGQPMTDPVTGEPVFDPTKTETTTETTEQTPNKPAEGEDLECGLPGTPPCKIDESGTPGTDEANFDKGEEEIENFKSGLLAKIQAKLDEIVHEWTWTFALPTGCAALQFDTQVGPVVQIDMCEWQPMIHDIMSMIWAAAGVFGAMMIFLRSNG